MAKRADSQYLSGARTDNWLKIKTSKRQEVVIAGFTAPRRTRPCFGALVLAIREGKEWRFIGHVGAGFSHATLKELHGKQILLKTAKSPFPKKVRGRSYYYVGKAYPCGGNKIYRVDELRRNAPSRLFGT